jgi:hypothetical protein
MAAATGDPPRPVAGNTQTNPRGRGRRRGADPAHRGGTAFHVAGRDLAGEQLDQLFVVVNRRLDDASTNQIPRQLGSRSARGGLTVRIANAA